MRKMMICLMFLLLAVNLSPKVFSNDKPSIAVINFETEDGKNPKAAEQFRMEIEMNLLNTSRFHVIERGKWLKDWESLQLPFSPSALTRNAKLKQLKGIDYFLAGAYTQRGDIDNLVICLIEAASGDVKQTYIWHSDEEKWSRFMMRFWTQLKSIFLLKGRLVKMEGEKVYLSEGISASAGVFPGDIYVIQRETKVTLANGKTIGNELKEIAKVKVTQVYDKFVVAEVLEKNGNLLPGDLAQETVNQISITTGDSDVKSVGSKGLIAFSSNREGNFDIYIRMMDGGLKNITKNPACDISPSWSPDQDKIAFASNRDGEYAIYVMDIKDEKVTRLTPPEGYISPAWSPNGKMIAFLSTRNKRQEGGIFIMNADGSGMKRLTKNSMDSRPSWSKDSRYLTFSGLRSAFSFDTDIFVININTGDLEDISRNSFMEMHPVWSPDQTHIAFISNRDGNFAIYTLNYKSLVVSRIMEPPASSIINNMTWSPDGKFLIVDYSYDQSQDIYQLRLEDGDFQKLIDSPYADIEPAWTK